MTILEYAPSETDVLDFIDDGIRQLQEAGHEARYIVMGPAAFERFKHAMAARYNRIAKDFERYNFVPIVLDPFRTDTLCVLPAVAEIVQGVEAYRVS